MQKTFPIKCKDEAQRKKLRLLIQSKRQEGERVAECLIRILEGKK